MPVEIERKFLVTSNAFKTQATSKHTIIQGFLNRDPERTVRIRLQDENGILTIKGKSSADGVLRFEWEKQISKADAKALLQLCENGLIHKTRHIVPNGKTTIEVDEFYDDNKGLIIAEIELENETDTFNTPDWLGAEVTGNIRYYNSSLSKLPYTEW